VSPLVTPNPLEMQRKATNAINWKQLAQRTVTAIPAATSGPQFKVWVARGTEDIRFSPIYRQYLEEALYANGFIVLKNPVDADIVLDFTVEPLLYDKGGKKLVEYGGFWTTAGGLGAQFRGISSLDTGLLAGAASGVALDFAAAINGATRAEVVVTSTLTSPRTNHFHFVRTESFYVRPADLEEFYERDQMPVVSMRVSGSREGVAR
jgi:hypothetical protein